jgi:hypothetical protein
MSWWGRRTVASAVGRGRGAIGNSGRHAGYVQVMAVLKTTSVEQSDIVRQESDSMLALLEYVFCRSDAALTSPQSMSITLGRHVRIPFGQMS